LKARPEDIVPEILDINVEITVADRSLIEEHLQRLLLSEAFDASERNRRFLRYIVEETFRGRGDRLKGYSIALAVFDRDSSFDPQLDPVVRIEAGRLRRSLERYYLTEGSRSSIKISVPKGRYVPVFEHRPTKEIVEPSGFYKNSIFDNPMRINVFPVDILAGSSDQTSIASILMDEIIIGLSRTCSVRIARGGLRAMMQSYDQVDVGSVFIDDYLLRSSVHFFSGFVRYIGYLIDRGTGNLVWNKCIDVETRDVETASLPERISDDVIDGILSTKSSKTQPEACH
jgi:TolB-like protein